MKEERVWGRGKGKNRHFYRAVHLIPKLAFKILQTVSGGHFSLLATKGAGPEVRI